VRRGGFPILDRAAAPPTFASVSEAARVAMADGSLAQREELETELRGGAPAALARGAAAADP
jgi:hypothetical protein